MNRGIHSKSGTFFMGLAVNAGISIWNEDCSACPLLCTTKILQYTMMMASVGTHPSQGFTWVILFPE